MVDAVTIASVRSHEAGAEGRLLAREWNPGSWTRRGCESSCGRVRSGLCLAGMEAVHGLARLRLTSRRIAALMLVGCLVAATADAAPPAGNAQASATGNARWVSRTIHFMYSAIGASSETTFYSCDRLQGLVTAILSQLGARDATVKPFGCFTNGGPEKFPGVDATFSVLVPADSGDQSEPARVEAHWQKVTLNTAGSCALMEQVKRRILPLFATRNPGSGCSPTFSVEVLQPVRATEPVS